MTTCISSSKGGDHVEFLPSTLAYQLVWSLFWSCSDNHIVVNSFMGATSLPYTENTLSQQMSLGSLALIIFPPCPPFSSLSLRCQGCAVDICTGAGRRAVSCFLHLDHVNVYAGRFCFKKQILWVWGKWLNKVLL